jgi:hypothetical protein
MGSHTRISQRDGRQRKRLVVVVVVMMIMMIITTLNTLPTTGTAYEPRPPEN